MASSSPAGTIDNTAWVQLDALASSTVMTVQNRDTTQSMGLVFAVSTPGALAWNGDGAFEILPGGSDMFGKATSEHAWIKMQTGAATAKPVVQEKL